ncbi:MAG: hypothetical protein AAB217_02505, partial [Chloroflexota bacterium]
DDGEDDASGLGAALRRRGHDAVAPAGDEGKAEPGDDRAGLLGECQHGGIGFTGAEDGDLRPA